MGAEAESKRREEIKINLYLLSCTLSEKNRCTVPNATCKGELLERVAYKLCLK